MLCLQRKDHLPSKIYCPFSDLTDKCNIIQYYCRMFPKLYFNCLSDEKDALIIMPNCAERTIAKTGICIDVPMCFYRVNEGQESKEKCWETDEELFGNAQTFIGTTYKRPKKSKERC